MGKSQKTGLFKEHRVNAFNLDIVQIEVQVTGWRGEVEGKVTGNKNHWEEEGRGCGSHISQLHPPTQEEINKRGLDKSRNRSRRLLVRAVEMATKK